MIVREASPQLPPAPPRRRRAVRIPLPITLAGGVVALGTELKNTICTAVGQEAWISETHGNLQEIRSFRRFVDEVERERRRLRAATGMEPVHAHDLHPAFLSTLYARRFPRSVGVQHHHAHGVSAAVDAGLPLPVIGVIGDGTGYGSDGAAWGGEILVCRERDFDRFAHLDYFALPGGDAAASAIWRVALALLAAAEVESPFDLPQYQSVAPNEHAVVRAQIERQFNAPPCSSLGRLFDGIAFLTGVCQRNNSEAQAACALERAARNYLQAGHPLREIEPYSLPGVGAAPVRIDWRPMVRELLSDVQHGREMEYAAARFHATLIDALARLAEKAALATGIDRVVLSGGCFANSILREGLDDRLTTLGLTVGTHMRVPTGDAGVSLGQAVIAGATAAAAD